MILYVFLIALLVIKASATQFPRKQPVQSNPLIHCGTCWFKCGVAATEFPPKIKVHCSLCGSEHSSSYELAYHDQQWMLFLWLIRGVDLSSVCVLNPIFNSHESRVTFLSQNDVIKQVSSQTMMMNTCFLIHVLGFPHDFPMVFPPFPYKHQLQGWLHGSCCPESLAELCAAAGLVGNGSYHTRPGNLMDHIVRYIGKP